MSGSKPGERRGGRPKGGKNKATLEREQRALDVLRGKAARLAPQVWAKDELEDLIPEAKQLVLAVKGVVARLQARALAQLQGEGPITDFRLLDKLKEWSALLKETEATASLIMSRAGEYQSPKAPRMDPETVLAFMAGLAAQQRGAAPAAADDNVIQIDDPNAASRVYQRFIQAA